MKYFAFLLLPELRKWNALLRLRRPGNQSMFVFLGERGVLAPQIEGALEVAEKVAAKVFPISVRL